VSEDLRVPSSTFIFHLDGSDQAQKGKRKKKKKRRGWADLFSFSSRSPDKT